MKLAVSALCWTNPLDFEVMREWRGFGIQGVEAVPGKMLPSWPRLVDSEAREAARRCAEYGLEIPAMQGILFGRPEACVFKNPKGFVDAVMTAADAAAAMGGVPRLVWGAPASRRCGGVPFEQAATQVLSVLREAAEIAWARGTTLLVEHNPPAYGCDFVMTPAEAAELALMVGHRAFGWHLDVGGMADDPDDGLARMVGATHLHVSERGLAPFQASELHVRVALEAHRICRAWASLEMLPHPQGDEMLVENVLEFVKQYEKDMRTQ